MQEVEAGTLQPSELSMVDHLLHSLMKERKAGFGNLESLIKYAVASGKTEATIGRTNSGIKFDVPAIERHIRLLAANVVLRCVPHWDLALDAHKGALLYCLIDLHPRLVVYRET